ncbi:hypothetical protein [Infirmifilum sp. NZ]|uniref:hypothetical protein n=1 Tax=Infirmifilum sp. NZ TaxID=2926850 RepID=UPI002799FAA2|nr:hypothetical protein [Infirmifilum sp. NZ]UNQ72490.1 hypothetical protein MOV14_04995 [Infirmifilum sp. NZ]
MEESRRLEAVAVAYSAMRREARLASELLQTVKREAGGLERLDLPALRGRRSTR